MKSRIFISFKTVTNAAKPVLQIEDNGVDQVIIRFIPYNDEHISIHLADDGKLLRTHSSSKKKRNVNDYAKVEIARNICHYRDYEKHGNYLIHSFLGKLENEKGYRILGRLIDLDNYSPKNKYTNKPCVEFLVPHPKFMLYLFLSTYDNPCSKNMHRTHTALGDICFAYEKPKQSTV